MFACGSVKRPVLRLAVSASIRQYKVKIKEWGLEKYIKAADMQVLLAKRDRRARDRGVGTVFVVKGVKFEDDRLNRFGKRGRGKSSDHVSPSTGMSTSGSIARTVTHVLIATPAGVNYYTPQSIIDAESPHVDTNDVFILQNAHHYRKIGTITIVQAAEEPVQIPAKESVASLEHSHQAAQQGIACRGRFSDGDQATQLLWQARNFAIGFAKIMLGLESVGVAAQNEWSDRPLAPQFWVSPQAPEGPGRARVQRLVECVKDAILCKRLIGVGRQDSSRWLGDWRLMNETEVSNVENAGRITFGNTSLPYPEMEIFTLWIKFDRSGAKMGDNLLRACLCVNPDQERQDCNFCHSTCLVLDYMDPEGAVKLNIPLFCSNQEHSQWAHFQDEIRTHKKTIESTWRDVNYIYQGMTPVRIDCKRHKKTKTNTTVCSYESSGEDSEQEVWDAQGRSDLTLFEPFPPTGMSWICPDVNELLAQEEAWDSEEDPLVSDEEVFEPFAAE